MPSEHVRIILFTFGAEPESDLTYLERMPRRLYLCYAPQPSIRLPISLSLYEVLVSAASPEGGFPATLWARERDVVVRFMSALNRRVRARSPVTQFVVQIDDVHRLQFTYKTRPRQIDVST